MNKEQLQVMYSRILQVSGLIVLIALAFLYMFPDEENYNIYFSISFSGPIFAVVLMLTSIKAAQGAGASLMVLFSTRILGETFYSLLEEQKYGTNYGGWTTLYSLSLLGAGAISAVYLFQSSKKQTMNMESLLVIGLTVVFVIAGYLKSGPGYAVENALEGWGLNGAISILIPLAFVTGVIFFSDISISIVIPMYIAASGLMSNFAVLPYLFRDSGQDLYGSLGSYQDAANDGKPNVIILIQVLLGIGLLGYCIFSSGRVTSKSKNLEM